MRIIFHCANSTFDKTDSEIAAGMRHDFMPDQLCNLQSQERGSGHLD
jgi:hypothetical protein